MNSENLHIHYDCDPGQDDAIALLYALGAGVDVKSISTVGGNVDVKKCTRNVLQILEFVNRSDIPVYTGAFCPLKRISQPLPNVFGECGMAGANLPDPSITEMRLSAADFLLKQEFPNIFVATGPLTNVALAIQKCSEIAKHIHHLIIMGGCVYPEHIHGRLGNIQVKDSDGWAEYNFAVDPEAAQIVLSSQIKNITMIPVEVTRRVLYNHVVDDSLRASGARIAILAANILSTVGAEDRIDYASEMMSPHDPVRAMHDVVAMAYLIHPEFFETEMLPLRVLVGDAPVPSGQIAVDELMYDHPCVRVITKMDNVKFLESLLEYLSSEL